MSLGPLRVASILWQPRAGAWALTVACKATYTLAPSESSLAPEQDEPSEADVYWDGDERRSLYLASDLAPFKRLADVILVGSAYAPGRRPVASLMARLMVGEIDKSISVYGDRSFSRYGELRGPAPFMRMPLLWERAGGGPGTANPVGVPPNAAPDARGMSPVPNLQPPGAYLTSCHDLVEPVGFGPIPPTWPSRTHRLHRHGARWNHGRWHEQPLPDDIDAGYFNAAPLDQQVTIIRPDERIVLENLHPDHPRLVTQLRTLAPHARVEGGRVVAQEMRLRCDTLWIDTDRGTCSLTWRGYVPLEHPHQAGQVVFWLAEEARASGSSGRESRYDTAVETAPDAVMSGGASTSFVPGVLERAPADKTLAGSMVVLGAAKPVLPFVESQTLAMASSPVEPALTAPARAMTEDSSQTLTGTQLSELRDALPFVNASAAASPLMQAPAAATEPLLPPSPSPSPLPPPPPLAWIFTRRVRLTSQPVLTA